MHGRERLRLPVVPAADCGDWSESYEKKKWERSLHIELESDGEYCCRRGIVNEIGIIFSKNVVQHSTNAIIHR